MRDSYTNRKHVRHTKCGRMRGMVVGEGGRSPGVLLYIYCRNYVDNKGGMETRSLVGLAGEIGRNAPEYCAV